MDSDEEMPADLEDTDDKVSTFQEDIFNLADFMVTEAT
jgi:hypothetical protein